MSRREEPLVIPRVNADLRAYVRKKHSWIWSKTIAWELFWILVFRYYGNRNDMSFDYRFSLVLSALLLFGLFSFGWVRMMLDRNYIGIIRRIEYKQVFEPMKYHRVIVQQMQIVIEEESGRKHRITLPKKNGFDRYYHVGDKIVHYSGLTYPESNDGADRHLYVCSLCGGVEMTDTDHCHGCGFSLIKPVRSRYEKTEERFF